MRAGISCGARAVSRGRALGRLHSMALTVFQAGSRRTCRISVHFQVSRQVKHHHKSMNKRRFVRFIDTRAVFGVKLRLSSGGTHRWEPAMRAKMLRTSVVDRPTLQLSLSLNSAAEDWRVAVTSSAFLSQVFRNPSLLVHGSNFSIFLSYPARRLNESLLSTIRVLLKGCGFRKGRARIFAADFLAETP